ncbi:hypothetical protein DFH06DRAFT_1331904 [Mycena polygramma]|nr:hypothetical protein DFH06DRAFT_1331904 [Mycena polygramma]
MSDSTPKSPFPAIRRVVTGHTTAGKATVVADTVQPPKSFSPESASSMYDLYRTSESPAVIDSEVTEEGKWVDEIAQNAEHVSKDGSTLRAFDLEPNSVSPFHRTVSLDYAVVVKGSVVLELDDGKRVKVNEGDTVVQRGTIHAWKNESTTDWARIFFITLGAKPVEIDGVKLEQEWRV